MAGLSSENVIERMLNSVDKDKRPPVEIEKRIYICKDGRIYQPASHIERSLMEAVDELEYLLEDLRPRMGRFILIEFTEI